MPYRQAFYSTIGALPNTAHDLICFFKGNSLIVAHDPSGPLHGRNSCLDRGVGAGTLDGVLCGDRVVEDLGCGGHGHHRIVGSGALEKLNGETSGAKPRKIREKKIDPESLECELCPD